MSFPVFTLEALSIGVILPRMLKAVDLGAWAWTAATTISHVGIETTLIREVFKRPEVQEAARKLREKHASKVLIAGVDVCQPLKMLAFEQFFSNCPSWKDKLVFVERANLAETRLGDQNYNSNEIRIAS